MEEREAKRRISQFWALTLLGLGMDSDDSSSEDENWVKDRVLSSTKQVIYAERKRARTDTVYNPRIMNPYEPLSVLSGSPSRPKVFTQREHRLPIDSAWQAGVMSQWTKEEWVENVRLLPEVFQLLVVRLAPRLKPRTHTGGKRETPIWCQIAGTLAWLRGAKAQDIRERYGMRGSAFKKLSHRVLLAIVSELAETEFVWPKTREELDQISTGFKKWTHFDGVVGAVDGLIIRSTLLSKDNAQAMFCPRKDAYRYNVQAICSHDCRFTWMDCSNFASVHDGRAVRETKLWDSLEGGLLTVDGTVESGHYFLIGDNAYALRPYLLHPWKGRLPVGSPGDCWNFYLSAGRCTVERAFGQLVLTWQLLKNGLACKSTSKAVLVIQACFLLHNLRIRASVPVPFRPSPNDEDELVTTQRELYNEDEAVNFVRTQMQPSSYNRVDNARLPGDRNVQATAAIDVAKETRNCIAHWLLDNGFVRPGAL